MSLARYCSLVVTYFSRSLWPAKSSPGSCSIPLLSPHGYSAVTCLSAYAALGCPSLSDRSFSTFISSPSLENSAIKLVPLSYFHTILFGILSCWFRLHRRY